MDYRDYRKKYGNSANAKPSDSGKSSGSGRYETGGKQTSRQGKPDPSVRTRYGDTLGYRKTRTNVHATSYSVSKKKKRYGKANAQGGKFILAAIILLTVLLVAIIATVVIADFANRLPVYIASKVTVEAGRKSITANDFIVDKSYSAEFSSSTSYSLNHVGTYKIRLSVGGSTYKTTLKVVDTVAPTADAVEATVRVGSIAKAINCVSNVKDATDVTASFKKNPDLTKIGVVPVTVILRDEGGNQTTVESTINVVENAAIVNSVRIVECGAPVPDISAFVGDDGTGYYITDIASVDTSVPGYKNLLVRVGASEYEVTLICKDTVAPTATVTPQVIWNDGDVPPAESFVSNVVDATQVTVSYVNQPVKNGTYPLYVKIKLADSSGNSTVYDSFLTEGIDHEAPVLTITNSTIDINLGDTAIAWRSGVKATDNSGYDPVITLDTTGVNMYIPGTYTITFVATDAAGNVAKKTGKLTIHSDEITPQMLDDAVKALCDSIFTDNMSILDKMKALYTYLSANKADKLKYASSSPHDDWRREAYLSLTSRKSGDCFAYAAVSHAVFQYLGYESLMIERDEAYQDVGTHWWNMINIGTETSPVWYHFDATPMRATYKISAYAMTDAQVEAYTRWRDDKINPPPHYYMYDKAKYPKSSATTVVKVSTPSKYYE